MGRVLSNDLRERVLKASSGGLSARQAAIRFGVAASTAIRWIDRARQGERGPRKTGRKRVSRLDAHDMFIVALIEERKDITLDQMVVCLADERDVKIGRSMLNKWLRSRGFTYKKRPHMHWSRKDPGS
jgi:transposase